MNDFSWVEQTAYPFQPRYRNVEGGQMHYVNKGQGRPLVMVHGTPTGSFLYRTLFKSLSSEYRLIAPDHIGLGLSDKPEDWPYRPQDHASNLETLIEHLGLKDIVLMVHDFGGPIGLTYALNHPKNVSALKRLLSTGESGSLSAGRHFVPDEAGCESAEEIHAFLHAALH